MEDKQQQRLDQIKTFELAMQDANKRIESSDDPHYIGQQVLKIRKWANESKEIAAQYEEGVRNNEGVGHR